MKRIIDIPEKVLTAIQNGEDYRYDIHTAIAQGKPYEEKQGEWELHGMIYYCSECGHDYEQGGNNFCGNCGAKMKGGAE